MIFGALVLLLGTSCQRGISFETVRNMFTPEEEEPFAVSPPDRVLEAEAQREQMRRLAASAQAKRKKPSVRRVRTAGLRVGHEDGRKYLKLAMNSGAPAFIQVNGRRVIHSVTPIDDPSFRLASRVEIDGRTLYTYRDLH